MVLAKSLCQVKEKKWHLSCVAMYMLPLLNIKQPAKSQTLQSRNAMLISLLMEEVWYMLQSVTVCGNSIRVK